MKKIISSLITVVTVLVCIYLVINIVENTKNTQKIKEIDERFENDTLEIKDIAYDVRKDLGYHIFIKEMTESGEVEIPYLVITDDYDGNTLLIREELLDEKMIISGNTGEYERTRLDKYLREVYFETLSYSLQNEIVDSTIEVTRREIEANKGKPTKFIKRKVFILSHTELGFKRTFLTCALGKPLKYFKNTSNKILYKNEIPVEWFNRSHFNSQSTWCIFFAVSENGELVPSGCSNTKNYVRPAFCLPNNSLIKKTDTEGYYRLAYD